MYFFQKHFKISIIFHFNGFYKHHDMLSLWGRVMHICVSNLGHHWFTQWLVACYLNQCCIIINWILRKKFLFEIQRFSIIKMHSKMLSGKCHPFCLGLNVFIRLFHHDTMHVKLHSVQCINQKKLEPKLPFTACAIILLQLSVPILIFSTTAAEPGTESP